MIKIHSTLLLLVSALCIGGCGYKTGKKKDDHQSKSKSLYNTEMKVNEEIFGILSNEREVKKFILNNKLGMEVEIIEYGAIVRAIRVPDKSGKVADIVLGYDDLDGYINDPYYFGGTIGRVANRMKGASFILNGKKYELAANTLPDFGNNSLHGGVKGFNKVLWKGKSYSSDTEVGVILEYHSPDGEEGYPGDLQCMVKYSLNDNNELKIDYSATTNKTTLVNFTHHSYFNLKGEGPGTVLDHQIEINANEYTPADDDLIPTGAITPAKGTPVDFTTLRTIRSQINEMQMAKFKGYDLNYVLNHTQSGALDFAAKAVEPLNGRMLEVYTTQPCMHFYTSNFLEGKPGKDKKPYQQYGAFCFEPQGYPDAPHHENFQSVELSPGEKYQQTIIYKFSVLK